METTTEIALLPANIDAVAVFTGEKLDDFLARIKAEASKLEPDTTTAKGRKEIASMAYKVAQSKIALDNLGKNLVADWKTKAAKVDEARRKSSEFLDTLKEEVRKPLTEWEAAKEARIQAEEEAAEYAAAWDEAPALHDLWLREQAIAAKEAEQARKEAEAKAQAEAEEAARRAKEEAEAKAKAEAERLAANRNHRAKINREALADIMAAGLTEEQGKNIIGLIAGGKIKHLTITY